MILCTTSNCAISIATVNYSLVEYCIRYIVAISMEMMNTTMMLTHIIVVKILMLAVSSKSMVDDKVKDKRQQ